MTTRRYRLRPTNTFAAVLVRNDDDKLLSRLGHDHVVRADDFTSTVAIDPEQPQDLRFALDFPVHALVVDDPDDRRRLDLDPDVSERDRATTRDNMLADDQLHAERFGTIGFRVDGAHSNRQGQWILEASLTVRRHRFDFDFPVDIDFSPQLRASGRVDMTHRDLNLEPYRAPMGTLKNRQQLTFVVEIDAVPL